MDQQSATEEWNEFDINTQHIVQFETPFLSDPDNIPAYRKYPSEMGFDLESIIRHILVKHCEPQVDYSVEFREYLLQRTYVFNFRDLGHRAFAIDYFMITSDVPREEQPLDAYFGNSTKYLYLFSYDQSFIVTRNKLEPEQFELLFAFALRQSDLMKIFPFLNYHLEKNFQSDLKEFLPYITQLNRKFSLTLFTDQVTKSIDDWIADKKNVAVKQNQKKVKTYLSVDKLAYLFRALVDHSLISDENKADVVRMITDSFQSKMREDLSRKSVEDKFFNPTDDAIAFWKDQFTKLSSKAEKDFEKNRK